MSQSQASADRSIGRWIVGRPRIWVGFGWCVIGLAWLTLALLNMPDSFGVITRYVFGAFFLGIGILYLVVALRDRRLGLGRYWRPGASDTRAKLN